MTQSPLWRKIQRENFTDWQKLLLFLELERAAPVVLRFPLNLPRRLAEKVVKGTWDDPILLQFLPTEEEAQPNPLFVSDPVEDKAFCKTSKLLQKYAGRALLLCTSACAMHCRYCFRQNFDYEKDKVFEAEIAAIAEDSSISEVLLSGGDPLSLTNAQLKSLLQEFGKIPHVKRIRFHTRFPMGIPERIDEVFLEVLKDSSKQIIFVIHCNHAREFDAEIFTALRNVQKLGIPVLTQSVLLKGINDNVETLVELFELVCNHGIMPYYLHQLDRVQGAAHFEVSVQQGLTLMKELPKHLPGYAIPRYVQEVPHLPHKMSLSHSI